MTKRTKTNIRSFVVGMLLGAAVLTFLLTSESSNEARITQIKGTP